MHHLYFRDHRVEIPLYTHVYEMLYLIKFSHIFLSDEMLYFYGISSLLFIYVSILAFIHTVQQSHKA